MVLYKKNNLFKFQQNNQAKERIQCQIESLHKTREMKKTMMKVLKMMMDKMMTKT